MTIFIDSETLLRVNINYEYKGYSKLDTPEIREAVGVIEIEEPQPPQEAQEHPDWYMRTEEQSSPYVVWTRRSDEMIYESELSKAKQSRESEYKNTTDALFFKEQRGEVETGTWLKAVEAIKLKYPYPVQGVGDGSN